MASLVGDSSSKGAFNQQTNYLIKTFKPLIKGTEIDVFFNPQNGFFANVYYLTGKTDCERNVFLKGIPEKLKELNDVEVFKVFFSDTWLHLVKKQDKIKFIEVKEALKGGVKAKIPFQAGMALGSIVDGDSIEKMEKYAQCIASSDAFQEQLNNAENKIYALTLKIKNREKRLKKAGGETDPLIEIWKKEIEVLKDGIIKLQEKIKEIEFSDFPILSTFHSSIASPIDFQKSQIANQVRSFDSLNYSSQYISMKEDLAKIEDKISQSSTALGTNIEVGWSLWNAKANTAVSRGVADRVGQIKKEGKTEGILLINASITSKQVRFFKTLAYDKRILKSFLDIIKKGDGETLKKYGISPDLKIYILTEAVLGGSFSAIITFLNKEESSKDFAVHSKELDFGAALSGGVPKVGIRGGSSFGFQNSKKTQDDTLRNSENLSINVEIFSQGALPSFSKEIIEREVFKHLNLNPAEYSISKRDKEIAKKMVSDSPKEREEAVCERQMQLESANLALINTIEKIEAIKEKQSVHTPSSVMAAYESFVDKMVNDPESGVPIGFNYNVLDEKMIEELLK